MKKSDDIEQVLASVTNVKRAEPSPWLITRIEARLQSSASQVVRPLAVGFAAASFAVLLALNVSLFGNSGGGAKEERPTGIAQSRNTSNGYRLDSPNFDLY